MNNIERNDNEDDAEYYFNCRRIQELKDYEREEMYIDEWKMSRED